MKTAGWSMRRVAGQVDRSEKTKIRGDRRIIRQALVDHTVTRSTIQADLGVAIVPQTISRHLAEANLKSKRPFRALPLTPEQRQLHLQWCQARSMWNVTDWQKVVFSDESRFVLGTDDIRVRVRRCPAYDSRSTLIVMRGTLTGQRYVDDILRTHVGSFLNGLTGAIFQQDNVRPHTARVAQDFLRHFQTLSWPARSPDLSHVEHVWDLLKRQMPSCLSKNSLVNVALYHIHHIWHYKVRLRESGQPIGRLRKTCKNAFPRTILVSFGRLDTPIATESSLNSTQILTKHWSVEPEKMDKKSKNKNNSNVTTEEKLNRLKDSIKGTLTRYNSKEILFELESLPDDSKEITKIEEEIYCEEHFVSTYKRDKTGRFIVRLPIKENAETLLGYSKENAIKRLNGIWEKLNKNNTMGTLYKEFMNEYELLGHMEQIKNETLDKINYYIPHHSVYKPEKTSTPLRVVFDASAKTISGFFLNSILLNGGIIQQDLFSIVSRFRKHEYAFSADIKKMYRQILVNPNQRDLQRIMWKTSAAAPVKTYKLATLTYGTVSAPFLATRTLKALADEEKAEFPDAADVICNDSYMDDVLSRESTLEGAKKLQTRLSQLLQRGGFELHKWVSHSPELLKDLSASSYVFDKEFQDAPMKTLGMLWDPKVGCLTYKVKISDKVNFSKRDVLSEIARLYDPLGLIGPIVTKAKIFIQEVWKIKLDWSEQLQWKSG
ncbi:transposable element Tcb2 transposase [Trichonephila clavipes]|nr:transposable element Tcb2 transposase [Trichonephila clavipes]